MAGSRTKRSRDAEMLALKARVAELELKVKMLEARVRTGLVQGRRPIEEARARSAQARRAERPRPRCPGCQLELPSGRREERCVWCGFQLDAVAATFQR
jgi:hypothetical protein